MSKIAVFALVAVVIAIVLAFTFRRSRSRSNYQAGEIYSVVYEKGFRVAKVLATDPDVVHVRLYKNVFTTRPSEIDESKLTLGTIDDVDGFGMGHLPLSAEEFRAWQPLLILKTSVRKDELDGYELWKESRGGVWGATK